MSAVPYRDPTLAVKWLQAHLYIKARNLQPYKHLPIAARVRVKPS